MQAARLKELKKDLVIEERETPTPGPGELLLEQDTTGICYRDLLTRDGFLPRVRLPITPGHEISGRIISIGEGGTDFNVGERVTSLIYAPCGKCEYCVSGRENLCASKKIYGEDLEGGYSRYVVIKEESAVRVPQGVGEEEAAIAACVTGMLYHALKVEGKLSPGEKVLVTGAGGGIGTHAIQIAKVLGAEVIAETSSSEKTDLLHELGADHVVMMSDKLDQEVKQITGDGVHLVMENVGIHTFPRSLRSLRTGGRMVVVGNVVPEPVPLPLGLIILKGNSIMGSMSSTRNDVAAALDLSRNGKIHAVSDGRIDLAGVNSAFEKIAGKRNRGRVFLRLP
ncbi:MAG: zinc-binding dehydrogenase [Candidatus Thermoplasmatota archaeon]|nr:zinc-binding dehydrogenase [Candidatus Thermoplasmatota archaeon]